MNKLLRKAGWRGFPNRRCVGFRWGVFVLLMLPLLLVAGCSGCADSSSPVGPGNAGGAGAAEQLGDKALNIAVINLNRLEEFVSPEILQQIIGQLNQWAQTQEPPEDWRLDPLLATLPGPFAELPMVKGLEKLEFPRYDASALQEAICLRDVSNWARGEKRDDLSQAKRLFDWTVRNIQLEPTPVGQGDPMGGRLGQLPWDSLFFGRATAMERAWVFVLLARQQGLDAALLALADSDDPAGRPLRPWAVGVLSKGKVYLFDPALGLPIPAPDGIRLDEAGQLDILPATLAEVAADDRLLRRLDLDAEHPYALKSSDLGRVVALIEASPAYLARRMKLLESRLVGDQKVVLTTSATDQINRWKPAGQVTASSPVSEARLWMLPYQTLSQHWYLTPQQARQRLAALLPFDVAYAVPVRNEKFSQPSLQDVDPFYLPRRAPSRKEAAKAPLRRGRMLHLKGKFTGEQSATHFYQEARPSDHELANLATQYYQMVLKEIQKLPEEEREPAKERIKQAAEVQARLERPLLRRAKQDASYWLGLVNFELGLMNFERGKHDIALRNYDVAVDYFANRTLKASLNGPWTRAAYYNLARAYEATGQHEKAIALYRGLLFRVGLGYQGELDSGVIPVDLRVEFETREIPLSAGVSVSAEQKGSRWVITDRSGVYTVIKEGDTLNVFVPTYIGSLLRARWLEARRPEAKDQSAGTKAQDSRAGD